LRLKAGSEWSERTAAIRFTVAGLCLANFTTTGSVFQVPELAR
jgi:hypothetical protein